MEGRYLMDTMLNGLTPSQRRKLPPADVFNGNCPSRELVEILSGKWATLLLWSLAREPMRFGELRRRLDGVTQKMLTQTLRTLERNGLVSRTVYATTPPSVEYALTPLGVSVSGIAEQMCQWAQVHIKDVIVARQGYDKAALRPDGVSIVTGGKRQS